MKEKKTNATRTLLNGLFYALIDKTFCPLLRKLCRKIGIGATVLLLSLYQVCTPENSNAIGKFCSNHTSNDFCGAS